MNENKTKNTSSFVKFFWWTLLIIKNWALTLSFLSTAIRLSILEYEMIAKDQPVKTAAAWMLLRNHAVPSKTPLNLLKFEHIFLSGDC